VIAAHTPGPWWTVGQDDKKKSQQVYSANGTCASAWGDKVGIRTGNARLIAAAPDLLEALQLIQTIGETHGEKSARMTIAAISKAIGDTQPANRTPGTVPMHSHDTTVGEGDMPVTCRFDFDPDGDIETMQVWAGAGAVNIFRALTLSQIEELEAECYAAAKADHEERKYDTAIDNFIKGQQS